FRSRPMQPDSARLHAVIDAVIPAGSAANQVVFDILAGALPPLLLPMEFMRGLGMLWIQGQEGQAAFLLGETSLHGWWYYFPVAVALKTTPALLLLLLLASWLLLLRRKDVTTRPGSLQVVAGAVVLLGVSMLGTLDIGVRYVLSLYPFLAVWASAAFAPRAAPGKSRTLMLAVVLLVWHAGESVLAHPDYLAYFTPPARGYEIRLLGDSNLDWGQDLARLSRYLVDHQIEEFHLAYFGTTSPEAVGIRNARPFEPGDRPRGWVAISVTYLQGIYPGHRGYQWLEHYEPHTRIGKSIYVYDLR
ncbi:MAG: hypothetical protein ACYSWU_27700, partial [Planctomycetota bacterium]